MNRRELQTLVPVLVEIARLDRDGYRQHIRSCVCGPCWDAVSESIRLHEFVRLASDEDRHGLKAAHGHTRNETGARGSRIVHVRRSRLAWREQKEKPHA